MTTHLMAADVQRGPGVRLLGSHLVARPTLARDGGARIIRIIGGRDGAPTSSAVRIVRRGARSTGTRAAIRIVGRSEASIPRAGIRVIGGQDAR